MDRIDKVISVYGGCSRKDAKKIIRSGRVSCDGVVILDGDYKVDISNDNICLDKKEIKIKKYVYLVLNKPKGYVSSTQDKDGKCVLNLISDKYKKRNLFPVGRLDKDTTGLMIISDDGVFAHNVLSPHKLLKKVYEVTIDKDITLEMIKGFRDGILLSDGMTREATLERIEDRCGRVTLCEGRYHEIKRMFGCYGAKVLELKRIKIGAYLLDDNLGIGCFREMSDDEVKLVLSN